MLSSKRDYLLSEVLRLLFGTGFFVVQKPKGFVMDILNSQKVLLTQQDIQEIFSIKKSTAEQWRLRGCGPKFIRLAGSRLIRYKKDDVLSFIENQEAVASTTEADSRRVQ